MKTYRIRGHLLILERVPHNGIVAATAIPDSGEAIHRRFIGYSSREIVAEMRALIKLEVGG